MPADELIPKLHVNPMSDIKSMSSFAPSVTISHGVGGLRSSSSAHCDVPHTALQSSFGFESTNPPAVGLESLSIRPDCTLRSSGPTRHSTEAELHACCASSKEACAVQDQVEHVVGGAGGGIDVGVGSGGVGGGVGGGDGVGEGGGGGKGVGGSGDGGVGGVGGVGGGVVGGGVGGDGGVGEGGCDGRGLGEIGSGGVGGVGGVGGGGVGGGVGGGDGVGEGGGDGRGFGNGGGGGGKDGDSCGAST